jgi:DNA-binding CsgD family transcriptional regulator
MGPWLLRSIAPPLFCRDFLLETGVLTIGRSAECDLVVNHRSVSRRHAKIAVTKSGLRVSDLNSRNGSWVQGKQIRRSTGVAAGKDLRFGDVIFVVLPGDHEEREESGSCEETASCESDRAEASLTPAQYRILAELLDGSSEKEIAAKLRLSPHTVHNHITAIHQRFGVHSRSELLAFLIPRTTQTRVAAGR